MDKNIEESLRKMVVQTLVSTTFTASTLYAGLLVWGWSRCVDLLVRQGDDAQLIKLIRKNAYQRLLTRLPSIEVNEETYYRWIVKKQIVSTIGEEICG